MKKLTEEQKDGIVSGIIILVLFLALCLMFHKGNPPDLESYEHHPGGGRIK